MLHKIATLLICVMSVLCLSVSLTAQSDISTGNVSSGWQIPNSTTLQGQSGTSDVVVQAGPLQQFTTLGYSGGIIIQGTPIGATTSAAGTVNPTILRGAPDAAPSSSGTQKAGDLYVGAGGTTGTLTSGGNFIPGYDHHFSAYRKGGVLNTPGHLQCLKGTDVAGGTGHNVVNDCATAAEANNNVGIMPASNDNFANPDGGAVYVQWGGALSAVPTANWEAWSSGDRICTDQNNPGYVTDSGGTNQCSCPSTQVGYDRLQEGNPLGIHTLEIVLGGCVPPAPSKPSYCQSSSGNCSAASAGSVTIPAGAITVMVNTTAVTANSQILVTEDATLGAALGVTCNSTAARTYQITARSAGDSFVITSSAAPAKNPACLNYFLLN
jgi:hypothetical protein